MEAFERDPSLPCRLSIAVWPGSGSKGKRRRCGHARGAWVEPSPRPSRRHSWPAGAERPEQRLKFVFVDVAAVVSVEHRKCRGNVLLGTST